jgi:hypothetical protein
MSAKPIAASGLTLLRTPQLSMRAGAPREETQHAENIYEGTPCEVELAVDVKDHLRRVVLQSTELISNI